MPVPNYLLDACTLLAFFNDEKGADVVRNLIDNAKRGEIALSMNAVNLIEVYYDRIREIGFEDAKDVIRKIYENSPITIIETITPNIVHEAARLKAQGKMSFADTILVATALCTGATIVSCDHVELESVEREENIPFLWIRSKF